MQLIMSHNVMLHNIKLHNVASYNKMGHPLSSHMRHHLLSRSFSNKSAIRTVLDLAVISNTIFYAMEEESGRVVVDLFPAAKRSKSDLDIQETGFSKCIICQKKGREGLSKGSSTGIMRVIESCSVKKDDVFDRLQKEFNDLASKSPV